MGLFSASIVAYIFSKRENIKNYNFVVSIGFFAIIQAAISMNISNAANMDFKVTFFHGVLYIIIPAYLIYEITPNNKDIIKKLDENYQKNISKLKEKILPGERNIKHKFYKSSQRNKSNKRKNK